MTTIAGLTFAFGQHLVLDRLHVPLPERGLVALTGPNGIGKTTLLRVLGGIYPSQDAAVAELLKAKRVVYLDAECLSLDTLTVAELVRLLGATMCRIDRSALTAGPLLTESILRTRVGELSLGGRQRVVLAVATALREVDILLLDEPFNGLDESAADAAREALASASLSTTIVFATHDRAEIASAHFELALGSAHDLTLHGRGVRA
ncbi:MAG TPA: ABC transporter ATP-binding protein [Dermatophilaceae bacterium]|nr:ABC transporter ATP-binding protein [Dermatophilaceae bacterium]